MATVHREGWATVSGHQKYHHYDEQGRTRCGYQRKKGELSFAPKPASLSAWMCCSTCDSIILRTDAPVEAPAKFNYATDGQYLADMRAEQDKARVTAIATVAQQAGPAFEWNAQGVCLTPSYIYQGGDGKYNMLRVTAAKTIDGDWVGTVGKTSDFGGGLSHLPMLQSPRYATKELAVHAAITRLLATPAAAARCAGSLLDEGNRQALQILLKQYEPTNSPAAAPVAAPLAMSKFIVSSSALLKTLQPLAGVIANNPVVPALSNFLFDVAKGTLSVTASDLEVSVISSLPVESGKNELRVCVPSRLLLDLLKQLPDQPITFDIDEEQYRVQVNTANGRYKLVGENAADFPRVPVPGPMAKLEIPSTSLARAINKTIFGVSGDELRPAMTGVLLELAKDGLTFVATDGHRLLRYRRLDVGNGDPGVIKRAIIPKKAWAMLKSTLPSEEIPVLVKIDPSNAFFTFNGLQLVTRLIDERYPDYENVIPISNPNKLLINRLELLHAVRRCSLMSNKTTHQIRLALSGAQVTISAQDLDYDSEASEQLACQYDGEDMEIGFNSRFLTEMLSNFQNEEISLAMSTPNRAGLLEPAMQLDGIEHVLMLVMPVMLNNYV